MHTDGLTDMQQAFIDMLKGMNTGKASIKFKSLKFKLQQCYYDYG